MSSSRTAHLRETVEAQAAQVARAVVTDPTILGVAAAGDGTAETLAADLTAVADDLERFSADPEAVDIVRWAVGRARTAGHLRTSGKVGLATGVLTTDQAADLADGASSGMLQHLQEVLALSRAEVARLRDAAGSGAHVGAS